MKSQSLGVWTIFSRLRNLFSARNLLPIPIAWQAKPASIFIRHLDAGSCNDCELEIAALSNPLYDFERFGFHLVASPRHADILLVTGPFTRSMEAAALAAFRAMPGPRRVVTVGDGFKESGIFSDSYAVMPLPEELVAARVAHIPGDPPSPQQIAEVLLTLETK